MIVLSWRSSKIAMEALADTDVDDRNILWQITIVLPFLTVKTPQH